MRLYKSYNGLTRKIFKQLIKYNRDTFTTGSIFL